MNGHLFLPSCSAALFLPAADTPAMPGSIQDLLGRTSRRVERYWEDISAVSCIETISQVKLNPQLKVISQRREAYNYLLILQLTGDQLTVEESRELQGKAAKQAAQPLLVSNGFSVLMLVFHPHFQSSFVFRELDRDKPGIRRLAFEAIPGARSPSVIELTGRDYPIEWSGIASIDEATGDIHRIQAGLRSPLPDIGLLELKAEVSYAPVPFKNPPSSLWLPQTASVEAATRKQRWRNIHEFSAYRRFSVSTDVQIGEPH